MAGLSHYFRIAFAETHGLAGLGLAPLLDELLIGRADGCHKLLPDGRQVEVDVFYRAIV